MNDKRQASKRITTAAELLGLKTTSRIEPIAEGLNESMKKQLNEARARLNNPEKPNKNQ